MIDVAAERGRLEKDRTAAAQERERALAKLGNAQFVGKAPAAVIERTSARLAEAEADLTRIAAQLAALPSA